MTTTSGFDIARLDRIADHLQGQYVDKGRLTGCQIHVTRRGERAYHRNFGLMDRERGLPMADDTIFRIYSMTKPITAVALMTLYERGLFQLDDPISRIVPSWKHHRVWVSGEGETMVTEPAHRQISLRDLLNHSSGLTYGGGLPGAGIQHPVDHDYRALEIRSIGNVCDAQTFLDRLGKAPLRFQPGTAWMYSLASDACGALIEIMTGMSLGDYLKEAIFDPLGMVDTGFFVPPEKIDRFAANYLRNPDKTIQPIDDRETSFFAKPPVLACGGGGLVGTGPDYLRFCEMLRRGGELDGQRILGPRTIAMMARNHLPGDSDLTAVGLDRFADILLDGLGFGLGFANTHDQRKAGWLSHADFFWSGAAGTFFWVDPAEDMSVVFMTQLMPPGIFDIRGQLKSIIYSAIADR